MIDRGHVGWHHSLPPLLIGLALCAALACGTQAPADAPDPSTTNAPSATGALAPANAPRPNVIVILADDLGYGDVGFYGGTRYRTPAIDRLAAEGLRLTDFHVAAPVCGPSRQALLSGRYPHRVGGTANNDGIDIDPERMRAELARFFPVFLAEAGYATGAMGKWHVPTGPKLWVRAPDSPSRPTRCGFGTFRGFLSAICDYVTHANQLGQHDWWHDDELNREEGYLTHLITGHAVEFIETHADEPFFLYVSHLAPHVPHQLPGDAPYFVESDDVAGARVRGDATDEPTSPERYGAMLGELDASVATIMETVARLGLDERTLVVFLSDNGGSAPGDSGPFAGGKGDLHEGGHRVPAALRWPGRIAAGTRDDSLCSALDLAPTILELAGAAPPGDHELDGLSLAPLLQGDGMPTGRRLFWEWGNRFGDDVYVAAREGSWKIVGTRADLALYDLDADPGESDDLSERHPERVAQLLAAHDEWNRLHTPPAESR